MTANASALVVLSGGQDSTTCLFWAKQRFAEVHAITFDYGQRHRIEIDAAIRVAELANVATHRIVNVRGLMESTSPLVDHSTELERYDSFEQMDEVIGDRVELTFVPMRNAFFLTLAANRALALKCRNLVTGVCQQDNANYPDCRESFVRLQQHTINSALGITDFVIHAPLMHLSKAESVKLAMETPGAMEALAYSHTCYSGEFPPCGSCHACVLRAHGFEQAQVPDPLVMRATRAEVLA